MEVLQATFSNAYPECWMYVYIADVNLLTIFSIMQNIVQLFKPFIFLAVQAVFVHDMDGLRAFQHAAVLISTEANIPDTLHGLVAAQLVTHEHLADHTRLHVVISVPSASWNWVWFKNRYYDGLVQEKNVTPVR